LTAIAIEIGILLLLVVANGLFSMSEMAVVSSRRVRLEQMAQEGNAGAQVALGLMDAPSRFLSTVQIGITLIGIVSGAFGGAALTERLTSFLMGLGLASTYAEPLGFTLVVGVITYLSLVVGELVPKRIALSYPERIAALASGTLQTLSQLAGPLVRLLSLSTETLLRVSGIKESDAPAITQEEIQVLIEQGRQAGIIEQTEQELIERVFSFGDREAASLMTPRTEIVWLDVQDSEEHLREVLIASPHSRLPLCDGGLDRVIGIVEAKTLLKHLLGDGGLELRSLACSALFVPENIPAVRVLEMFRKNAVPLALVVDEFGSLQGLLTQTDILSALVGDLDGDPEAPTAMRRDDGSWLVDGALSLEELAHLVEELPELPPGNFRTLGGFVMGRLGRIPRAGDRFVWAGSDFEVLDMDGNRVDKVLVRPIPRTEPPQSGAPSLP
jgi:putative hemolysin